MKYLLVTRLLTKVRLSPGVPQLRAYSDQRRLETQGDIFYFSYGCVVLWEFTNEKEQAILGSLKEFEKNSILKAEMDEFTFGYGDNMRIEEDEIILQTKNTLTKLAISYGLAQSVKLTTFKETIQKTIDNTKYLPSTSANSAK